MGLKDKLAFAGGVALLGAAARHLFKQGQRTRQEAREAERRRSSPVQFDERLTQRDFNDLVRNVAASTPRVSFAKVDGLVVTIQVSSISGLSTWLAMIDFNDYGRLTGSYWIDSRNSESKVPSHFANAIQAEIKNRLAGGIDETSWGTSPEGVSTLSGRLAPPPDLPPAGWYPDPYGTTRLRHWDGREWTDSVH